MNDSHRGEGAEGQQRGPESAVVTSATQGTDLIPSVTLSTTRLRGNCSARSLGDTSEVSPGVRVGRGCSK